MTGVQPHFLEALATGKIRKRGQMAPNFRMAATS